MRFKETNQCDEDGRRIRLIWEHIRPDSGQVEKALGPPRFTKRCGKRRKIECDRIGWSFVAHELEPMDWEAGLNWRRY